MLETILLVLVLATLGLGSVIGLYIVARAYFGGRTNLRRSPGHGRGH